jgi:hypothetical protein
MKVVTEKFKPGTRAVLSVSGQWMVIGGRFWRNNSKKAKQTGSARCPACEKTTAANTCSCRMRGLCLSNRTILIAGYAVYFQNEYGN